MEIKENNERDLISGLAHCVVDLPYSNSAYEGYTVNEDGNLVIKYSLEGDLALTALKKQEISVSFSDLSKLKPDYEVLFERQKPDIPAFIPGILPDDLTENSSSSKNSKKYVEQVVSESSHNNEVRNTDLDGLVKKLSGHVSSGIAALSGISGISNLDDYFKTNDFDSLLGAGYCAGFALLFTGLAMNLYKKR